MGKQNKHIIQKLLTEMTVDLSSIDGAGSAKIAKLFKNKSEKELKSDLLDTTSELSQAIIMQKKNLQQDSGGQKYLTILGVINPEFTIIELGDSETVHYSEDPSDPEIPVQLTKGKEASTSQDMMNNPLLEGLFKGKNSILMELAKNVVKDLSLDTLLADANGGDGSGMGGLGGLDMTKMMGLISTVGSYVQDKVSNGELNITELESEASSFCTGLQDSEEFKGVMESNPEIMSLMNFM